MSTLPVPLRRLTSMEMLENLKQHGLKRLDTYFINDSITCHAYFAPPGNSTLDRFKYSSYEPTLEACINHIATQWIADYSIVKEWPLFLQAIYYRRGWCHKDTIIKLVQSMELKDWKGNFVVDLRQLKQSNPGKISAIEVSLEV